MVSGGAEEGFVSFVAARHTALLRFAVLLSADAHAGEDLLQSVLAKAYVAWPRIRDPHAAEAYVRRALVRTATSWWRSAWVRRESPRAVLPERAEPAGERVVEASVLAPHLAALPAGQRAVLVLRYYEDLSEAETAKLLGCSVGTVKSQAHRALGTLRERLREPDPGEARAGADPTAGRAPASRVEGERGGRS